MHCGNSYVSVIPTERFSASGGTCCSPGAPGLAGFETWVQRLGRNRRSLDSASARHKMRDEKQIPRYARDDNIGKGTVLVQNCFINRVPQVSRVSRPGCND